MQLFALDVNQKTIFANQAKKHCNYWCLECQSVVRLRGGFHKQNHFYHIDSKRLCEQNKKSMTHIQTQCFLQNLFSQKDCFLEYRFPEIQRIADVVWISQKIIFEIQCSYITAEEVKARNRDYASLGYQVVWILHDQRYNQKRLAAAEFFLQQYPHYFTNINGLGEGVIYDQIQKIGQGKRLFVGDVFPVNLRKIYRERVISSSWLQKKRLLWPFYFEGDLTENFLLGKLEDKHFLCDEKKESLLNTNTLVRNLLKPFRLIFQILLERACH